MSAPCTYCREDFSPPHTDPRTGLPGGWDYLFGFIICPKCLWLFQHGEEPEPPWSKAPPKTLRAWSEESDKKLEKARKTFKRVVAEGGYHRERL